MKATFRRFAALLLVFSVLCALPVPAAAAAAPDNTASPQSSYYIASTCASISESNGVYRVDFDIAATGVMTSLGATMIRIKNSSGTTVKTFYCESTTGMMGSNCAIFMGAVTYTGTPGAKYYAVVSFKAADSTGSDTTSYTTGYA